MKNNNVIINSDYGPIIINVNDMGVGREIINTGYFSKPDIHLLSMLVEFLLKRKDNLIIYDVGANIGTHSLALAKLFQGKVKIRAFEAQRQIFNMLCGTIAINNLNCVHCHNLAVCDKLNENIIIELPNYDSANNFGGLELITSLNSDNHLMDKNSRESVFTTTLDAFEENVDLIKIDIEGMEDKAFIGSSRIIEENQPICFVEILKTDINFLSDFFVKYGYIGFKSGINLIAIPLNFGIEIKDTIRIF